MNTHNIGFYEDLTKIIFELSSNIIKYAPYFFCWFEVVLIALLVLTYYRLQMDKRYMKDDAYVIKDCFNYTKEDLIPVRGKVQESRSSDENLSLGFPTRQK